MCAAQRIRPIYHPLPGRPLRAHAPDRVRVAGESVEIPGLDERHALDGGLAPLDLAGRLVREDLCVMERRDGDWRLTAASVCLSRTRDSS